MDFPNRTGYRAKKKRPALSAGPAKILQTPTLTPHFL